MVSFVIFKSLGDFAHYCVHILLWFTILVLFSSRYGPYGLFSSFLKSCCLNIQSSAETYIRFIMNSIGGKTLSPDIIGTATISGAKLFLMKDLKLIYIFQDKLIIKFYFKVTKRNANLPFLSVNFPSVCSEITSQIVCKFLQIIVHT